MNFLLRIKGATATVDLNMSDTALVRTLVYSGLRTMVTDVLTMQRIRKNGFGKTRTRKITDEQLADALKELGLFK